MSSWQLVFYDIATGRSPIWEYADGLASEEAARLTYDLELLEEFGLALGMPHVRPVRGKLWELRSGGRIQHRILYVAVRDRQIVLLHALYSFSPRPEGPVETLPRYQRRSITVA